MRKQRLGQLAIVVSMFFVTACGSSPTPVGSSKPDDVTLATFTGEVYGLDVIAQKQGFFSKHNLNVTFVSPQTGGAAAAQFLVSGSIAGWSTNPEILMLAAAKGEKIKFAGMLNSWIPYAIQVPENSSLGKMANDSSLSFNNKMQALKGKTIGLTGLGALVYLAFEAGLHEANVPSSAVTVLAVGQPASGIAQLNAGKIDGYATYSTADAGVLAAQAHTVQFLSLTGQGAPASISSLSALAMGTSADYASKHPQTIKNWVAALDEAYTWELKNPDAAAQIIADVDYNGQFVPIVRQSIDRLQQISTEQNPGLKVSRTPFNDEIDLLERLGMLTSDAVKANNITYQDMVEPYAQVP